MELESELFRNSEGVGQSTVGWVKYFPGEVYSNVDRRALLLEELTQSLRRPKGRQLLSLVTFHTATCALPVDVDFVRHASVLAEVFFVALAGEPKDAISCLGAAAYDVLFSTDGRSLGPEWIHVRISNFAGSILALKNLRAAFIDKLISVRGTVIRTSVVKPLVLSMSFTCLKCKDVREHKFKNGIYAPPTKCACPDCGCRRFTSDRKSAKLIDFQKIRLQELLGRNDHEDGRMPRTVDCELHEDVVDACGTGDVVTVCGFVKGIKSDIDNVGGKAKIGHEGLHDLYIEALSIVHSKDTNKEGQLEQNAFTSLDLEFVVKFAEDSGRDMFRNIVHSICPSIYGHELVKAGIALALFGGVRRNLGDDNKVPVRGDIHVLIVGDPGLGKSQLLKAASAVASRGVYVCGNTTTNAGLTVAVVKDALTGDYAFEAGAMVMADRGICCIDEFDKLSAEHKALLESMEQQCVSIAKAGLVASLPARTSVLAAANPVGGRYDRSKTLNENVRLSAALLSRFDIVFILLDTPDEAMDQLLSEHVLALHAGSDERQEAARIALLQPSDSSGKPRRRRTSSLAEKLKLRGGASKCFQPLPPQLLRKYVAYARQYVFPRLSTEAAGVLKRFYMQLRRNARGDGTPITARQLESLIRLAEARARLELREDVTAQDAVDAVDIMRESLFDKFLDERGCLDFGRSGGLTNQGEAKRFLSALQQKCDIRQDPNLSTAELYSVADEIDLKVKDLGAFIASLNLHGYLLLKGHNKYQVRYSSYSGSQNSPARSSVLPRHREEKRFLNALQQRCSNIPDSLFSTAELFGVAREIGMNVNDVHAYIELLNLHGYLLMKGSNTYQVRSSSHLGFLDT